VPQLTGKAKPKTDTPSPLSRFRRLLIAEGAVVVVLLFFAGILTLASPHDHEHTGNAPTLEQTHAPQPELFITQTEGFTVALAATAHPGGNKAFDLSVADETGNPVSEVQLVRLKFDYLDEDLGAVDFNTRAAADEDGHFRMQGVFMTIPGQWQITALIRMRGRSQDLEVSFLARIEGHSIKASDPG